jgi:hypothetical protein
MLSGPGLAAAACAVASAALLSCGGGDSHDEPPDVPPAELLRRAVADPAPSGIATVQLQVGLEGNSPLGASGSLSLHGPFELDPAGGLPHIDFDADAQVAGFGVDGKLVATEDDAFVVFFGENYRVGAERVAAVDAPRLRLDRWFEEPRYAGAGDVAGTDTEEIEGTLDASAASRDLGALASSLGAPALAEVIEDGAESGPVEAWIALEDTTVRRVSARYPFTVPPAQVEAARGVTGGTVSLDAQISNVGEEQTIEPPPGGGFKPVDRLIDRLSGLASLGGI